MNYLAHIYLSGNNDESIIGNFIADDVKPTERKNFSPGINKGFALHYAIDTFTDNHAIVNMSKRKLYSTIGKYAPVVCDVLYDHFLAKHWQRYHSEPLEHYTKSFYNLLHQHKNVLPERTKYLLNYMEPNNWLYHYQHTDHLQRIFEGMSRRARFDNAMHKGVEELLLHYEALQFEFTFFFAQLINHCHMHIRKHG